LEKIGNLHTKTLNRLQYPLLEYDIVIPVLGQLQLQDPNPKQWYNCASWPDAMARQTIKNLSAHTHTHKMFSKMKTSYCRHMWTNINIHKRHFGSHKITRKKLFVRLPIIF
jgi:hypothetical protein